MKKIFLIGILMGLVGICLYSSPKTDKNDILNPILKYIQNGDANSLKPYLDDNVELCILSQITTSSRCHASHIIKNFFDKYCPCRVDLKYKGNRGDVKYAIANLYAGGEDFNVTIFLNMKDQGSGYKVKVLKIEK